MILQESFVYYLVLAIVGLGNVATIADNGKGFHQKGLGNYIFYAHNATELFSNGKPPGLEDGSLFACKDKVLVLSYESIDSSFQVVLFLDYY